MEFFPVAGNYQIQFELNGKASNSIDVKIEMPKGKNLDAFNFLKKFENPLTFNWVWEEKDGIAVLESFVANYGDTPYGDFARCDLASVYMAKGEFAKARIEYNKLKSSKNKPISEEADKMLSNWASYAGSND